MTQENKDLLLQDLCGRLPYGVIMTNIELPQTHYPLTCGDLHDAMFDDDWDDVPYLRPMSSMTEEEEKEICQFMKDYNLLPGLNKAAVFCGEITDWLNKKMFDYRGLIPKGLALSTEEFNPYKD